MFALLERRIIEKLPDSFVSGARRFCVLFRSDKNLKRFDFFQTFFSLTKHGKTVMIYMLISVYLR